MEDVVSKMENKLLMELKIRTALSGGGEVGEGEQENVGWRRRRKDNVAVAVAVVAEGDLGEARLGSGHVAPGRDEVRIEWCVCIIIKAIFQLFILIL